MMARPLRGEPPLRTSGGSHRQSHGERERSAGVANQNLYTGRRNPIGLQKNGLFYPGTCPPLPGECS